MLIDMHMHEKTHSPDSHMSLTEIIAEARVKGLDAVCITDHDNQNIMEYAHRVSKEVDFPIFVGAEILTKQGDIVVFGLDNLPKEMVNAWELLEMVQKAGGIASVSYTHLFGIQNDGCGAISTKLVSCSTYKGFDVFR